MSATTAALRTRIATLEALVNVLRAQADGMRVTISSRDEMITLLSRQLAEINGAWEMNFGKPLFPKNSG